MKKIWFPASQTADVFFDEAHLTLTDLSGCSYFRTKNINYLCNKEDIIEMKRGLIGGKNK